MLAGWCLTLPVCGSCSGGGGAARKRRSTNSHSCGRWRVDTESLTEDVLGEVGLSLMEDTSGLPTPPDGQHGATPTPVRRVTPQAATD